MEEIQLQEQEIWKPIRGYEGFYEVSSLGRVRSLGQYLRYRHGLRWKPGKVRAIINCYGYDYVNLTVSRKEKHCLVHRLVAEAFIPNPENKRCVDHINTIRTDNRAENLRWVTHLENQKNPITASRLAAHSRSVVRISEDGSRKVYEMIKDATSEGFNMSLICECCNSKRGFHKGYLWRYLGEDNDCNYAEEKRRIYNNKRVRNKAVISIKDGVETEYVSISEAAKQGYNAGCICACCKGKLKQHAGYEWRYK